jgi:hypothetical protein
VGLTPFTVPVENPVDDAAADDPLPILLDDGPTDEEDPLELAL